MIVDISLRVCYYKGEERNSNVKEAIPLNNSESHFIACLIPFYR